MLKYLSKKAVCSMILILTLLIPQAALVQADEIREIEDSVTEADLEDYLSDAIYYEDDDPYTGLVTDENTGKQYYFEDGELQTGFQKFGEPEHTYYFSKKTGAMAKGFRKIKGKKYYFKKKSGVMKTGWLTYRGSRYYFKKNGKLKTGWLTYKGERYYFKKNGKMKTGTLKKGGFIYEFDNDGVLIDKYPGEGDPSDTGKQTRTKASSLAGLTAQEVIEKVGPLFTEDQKKSGVLACISLAQFILESGYGKSELATKANNCFGMKQSLSGNTWKGSTWDGNSVYTINTTEYGSYSTRATFRKYSCIEDSIADHSAYLTGAKDDDGLRYAGLKGCTNYTTAARIIMNGGYCTGGSYVSQLCSLITKWDLTRFNADTQ
ncbi:MAG: glucosaminidase domain-containing protein [Eubacterium sp.]|nr:glucosaminidase domain-containing protein [Eubacterium sp.]